MPRYSDAAREAIARCRLIAAETEEPGWTTRTFLSPPMHAVHAHLRAWMEHAGMCVTVDHAGNLRGFRAARVPGAPRFIIGSHLDTVPHAGAFDGILGVVLGVTLVELLARNPMSIGLEVIGFSEEEGVRFGVPFLGSCAVAGEIPFELFARASEALRNFGLDPARIGEARAAEDALGYLEFHIEQGPVLESLEHPLGVVEAIAGQSRFEIIFEGKANHAGTTPMALRRDALAAAAEWILTVEREALAVTGLVATVGRVKISPGAGNVIAGSANASLDVRHASDDVREAAVSRLLRCAEEIANRRRLAVTSKCLLDQPAVPMDPGLVEMLSRAAGDAGYAPHRMVSGAGHDAMILARRMPAAMLFLRSPGGISHHPDENVYEVDVAAALQTGMQLLQMMDARLDALHA